MEAKTSNFQIIILVVFGFFIFVGVLLFSTAKFSSKENGVAPVTPVVMWGTVSTSAIEQLTQALLLEKEGSVKITYVEKKPKDFEKDLVEAIADGVGPDLVIVPQDMFLKNINKFLTIPYESYPLRTFKDQFIDASSVYLRPDGIVAIPFAVDPIVMYWNKTHFVNAGIVNPPEDWDQFTKDVTKLTKKDKNFNVLQSGVAFGEYQNILHAKDILSMLFIQAGASVIAKNDDGSYRSALLDNVSRSEKTPSSTALSFYIDFANPSKEIYSWNRSLKSSLDSFISGDTSIYFGYASELPAIPLKNPNLNFDVASVPQVLNTNKKSTFARVYGLAILKSSKNQNSAFSHISILTSKDSITKLSSITNLPPVRRDVLVLDPASSYMKIFYDGALMANTFADPNYIETESIFKSMIETVISGKNTTEQAVNYANNEFVRILTNSINKQ